MTLERYEITRNGVTVEGGYGVEAECDTAGCTNQIDRGLVFLCGDTPGGDAFGCGGYFCALCLTDGQQCKPCSQKPPTEAVPWPDPRSGYVHDLRNEYLPPGDPFKPDGWVWKHLGTFQDNVPVLVPVKLPDRTPGAHLGCAITQYAFETTASVAWRQELPDKAATRKRS